MQSSGSDEKGRKKGEGRREEGGGSGKVFIV